MSERTSQNNGNNKSKNPYEGTRQNLSLLYVSLDNADTVIEGAPSFPLCWERGGMNDA
jgi:hypothetical protein